MPTETHENENDGRFEHGPEEARHHAGFVAVVGRPNVGKSTLINRLVGQKIAITSSKPQTTRVNQLGILTLENAQLVFVDTPGIHLPAHALGQYMVREARESLEDADVVLCLFDVSRTPNEEDQAVMEAVRRTARAPILLGLNKADLVSEAARVENAVAFRDMGRWQDECVFSAQDGAGIPDLLDTLLRFLPENPPFYSEEDVTQTHARDIAGELIREQVLHHTREEVPHSVAVLVEEFRERPDGHLYVAATIFVERESQKGIIIGKGASMLKSIGSAARLEIEAMEDAPVYLDLRVKVRKDWRKKDPTLRHMGYGR